MISEGGCCERGGGESVGFYDFCVIWFDLI